MKENWRCSSFLLGVNTFVCLNLCALRADLLKKVGMKFSGNKKGPVWDNCPSKRSVFRPPNNYKNNSYKLEIL